VLLAAAAAVVLCGRPIIYRCHCRFWVRPSLKLRFTAKWHNLINALMLDDEGLPSTSEEQWIIPKLLQGVKI